MSELDRAARRVAEQAHARARSLASDAIDMDLAPADTTWLAKHLSGCADCQSVAGEYRDIHDELRAMPAPEPPRDLWARTATALDEMDRKAAVRASHHGVSALLDRLVDAGRAFRPNPRVLAGVAAVGLVVVVTGTVVLGGGIFGGPAASSSGSPGIAAVTPGPTATGATLAVLGGNSYWVTPVGDVYEIKGGQTDCAGTSESCAVSNENGQVLGSVSSKSDVSVVISPNGGQAAVWNADKVVVMPLTGKPATVALDLLTPRPSAGASAAPSQAPTPAATAADTAAATELPAPTAAASQAATAAPTTAPANRPQAILDGYRVIGRDPEFSADGQWVAFSARPSSEKTGSDVFVWHVGWDRARVVTSSHLELFAGWLGSRILISRFAGTGGSTVASSYIYDPATDARRAILRPMLMPVVDPTGHYVVYWSGTVRFDAGTGLWEPGQGDLYFDSWARVLAEKPAATPAPPTEQPAVTEAPASSSPEATATETTATEATPEPTPEATPEPTPEATPTPAPTASATERGALPQRLDVSSMPGKVASWIVRWDATGRYLAIWVAGGSAESGRVTLLYVLPDADLINVASPLLAAAARANISFDGAQFVYTTPADGGDGKTYLFALPATPPGPSTAPVATPNATGAPAQAATPRAGESYAPIFGS